jgi:hypothetical protein
VPDNALFVTGDEVPEWFRGVELMSAGMEWNAATGPVTITLEHLRDAVAATQDPHIQLPRIKLGHSSPVNGSHEDHNPFAQLGDAEPSFGQFVNLRLANDGAVLIADGDNIPWWLAQSAPSTYPNRSAEATWQVAAANFDVQTNGGKRYSMVVTAVSLLGVELPAVSDLDDLQALIVNGPSALASHSPVALGAIASHDTAVIDEAWDGPAEEAKIPNDAGKATLRKMYAWVDPDKDADTKAAYKLPHHKVVDGQPKTANVRGVRNALSRLPQSSIPEADHDSVRAHLNRHLEKYNASASASLSVSYDTVRHRFNWSWAVDREGNDFDGDTMWWWARDVRFDPDEIIADDDEGNLWSVPFSTDGEDEVTFGEPARVRQTYVPVAAAKAASFSRPDKQAERPAVIAAATDKAATGRPDPEEENPMDANVHEFLVGQGHDPETATEQQVQAAEAYVAAFPDATGAEPPADDPVEGEPQGEVEGGEPQAEGGEVGAPAREPVAASRQVPEGMRLIDEAELETLRAGAEAGTRLAREKATEERDRILMSARDEGRFPPSRLAHYTRLYEADPEGTKVLLTAAEDKGGLAKGAVPLEARAQIPDPEGDVALSADELPAGVSLLNPSERAELRARRSA